MKTIGSLSKKLAHPSLIASLAFCSIGVQSASAITLTIPGLSSSINWEQQDAQMQANCANPKVPIGSPCVYTFNNFDDLDDRNTWLTINGEQWAIKASIIATTASLSNSTTGSAAGAKVFTFTAASIEYKGSNAAGGRLSGITFSHDFDFTTTSRAGTSFLSNPTISHRLSGQYASSKEGGITNSNRVDSNVSFSGSGSTTGAIQSATNPGNTPVSLTNGLALNSVDRSGQPFGSLFSFADGDDVLMSSLLNPASSNFYLKSGTVTATLSSIELTKGDTLYLPASECTVIHDGSLPEFDRTNFNKGGGNGSEGGDPGNHPELGNDDEGTDQAKGKGNQHKSDQSNGKSNKVKGNIKNDKVEKLCNEVARSVLGNPTPDPASVPEPNGAIPVLAGLMLWGAENIIRKLKP